MNLLFVLLREIIKNVFDHGSGEGVLKLRREGKWYEFEFIDSNPLFVSFAEACKVEKDAGWVKKTDSNCNVGMSQIQLIAKEKGMTLEVDDTKGGINYRGSYSPV